jgi:folate-binding protein YgfZ
MTQGSYVLLEDRGLIAVDGEEARTFLQGLVSNDVDKVTPKRAVYAAILTPQGKYLHDFFILQVGDSLVLDCGGGRREDLLKRLGMYKLRAKVTLGDRTDDLVAAVVPGEDAGDALGLDAGSGAAAPFGDGIAYRDPRLAALGMRAVLPRDGAAEALEAAGFEATSIAAYDTLRLGLGAPDGDRDMVVDKTLLMEAGFDALNGIDWDKGCYVGQELTARTKYRGIVRKRLVPVAIDGPVPAPGTPLMLEEREAGEMRSARDGIGLALIRLEHLETVMQAGTTFVAGEARLTPKKPAWADY